MKPGSVIAGSAMVVLALSIVSFGSSSGANLPREHDSGFFLRMSAGGGTARTTVSDVTATVETGTITSDLKFSGTAGDVNFAIGAIVSPNLALHGTIAGWAISDPDAEFGGGKTQINNFDMTMSMLGAGVTYYVMPSNIYLSGSAGAAKMRFSFLGQDHDSDTGFAVDLTAGKEWWVGSRWGLGVAVGANLHSVPSGDPDLERDFKGSSFAVRFSATMN